MHDPTQPPRGRRRTPTTVASRSVASRADRHGSPPRRWGRLAVGVGLAAASALAAVPAGATAASAAVVPDGVGAVAWGTGAIGDGTTGPELTSVPVTGFANGTVQVAAGDRHSLGVLSDGTVWAWGDNSSHQVGGGITADYATSPVQVPNLTNAVAVSGGYSFSLALRSDGTVWAWGSNDAGQLGNGTTTDSSTPVQVSGLTGVTGISAGGSHALALRSDGTVWTWGDNTWGELGVAGFTGRMSSTPLKVNGIIGATQVSGGEGFSLVLLSDGTVRAFGENASHELGDGTTVSKGTPVRVTGLTGITQIDAGWVHGLALGAGGSVWSWGSNAEGELGDGTTTDRPAAGTVPGLTGAVQISAGVFDSFAVLSDGTARAWGANPAGELGDGTETQDLTPQSVLGLTHAVQIDAGFGQTVCKVAGPSFAIASDPPSGSVAAGGQVTTQVSLTAFHGFTAAVPLSASGLPAGVTASFTPAQAGPGSPATMTLATTAGVTPGTYQVTVTGTDRTLGARTTTYQLTVTPAANFTVTLSQSSGSTDASDPASPVQVTLAPGPGFTGTATLAAGGLPAGATATFTPPQVAAGSPATMRLTTAPNTPPGTYPVTVTGSTATGSRSVTYRLTVTPAEPFALTPVIDGGGPGQADIMVTPKSWYAGSASMSVVKAPACLATTLSPTLLSSGDVTLTATATGSACSSGTFVVTVAGTPVGGPATPPLATVTVDVLVSMGGGDPVA